ncbi:MAG: K(+)-transporting ATPase subunit C [Verrucomicrobiae bacterium]|nr:K(+)-transporting ATPase subunit C [Verrucomicrobiae bacterium]MCB1092954.1 K(+)-transporting ATPase subunit C [Verrucomicrobiae bacterium]
MNAILTSLRLSAATILICVVGYGAAILALGQTLTPNTANGSLIVRDDGTVVGSRLIAQSFIRPKYFWPRLSAVDYDSASAGGSNLAPTNPALAERALPRLAALGASDSAPAPSDLLTASGSGLDPHISEEAALYQTARIASARGIQTEAIEALVTGAAFSPGGTFTDGRIVNVLELNLALDRSFGGQ